LGIVLLALDPVIVKQFTSGWVNAMDQIGQGSWTIHAASEEITLPAYFDPESSELMQKEAGLTLYVHNYMQEENCTVQGNIQFGSLNIYHEEKKEGACDPEFLWNWWLKLYDKFIEAFKSSPEAANTTQQEIQTVLDNIESVVMAFLRI
jgi:hypothetical protein